jgi:hypothetical protein
LICVNPYYSNLTKSVCKTYRLNLAGYHALCKSIGYEPKFRPTADLQKELATGDFKYTEKSDRSHHPLQNKPRSIKRPLLAANGYRFEYDIQCCVHTLILQHARQLGMTQSTPAMDQLVSDRSQVRQQIADACGISVDQVKSILTKMIQGATLSAYYQNSIFTSVNYNPVVMKNLQTNAQLRDLNEEFKACWSAIKQTMPVRYLTDRTGRQRRRPLSGGDKSEKYRKLESQVREVIERYLKRDKNRYFFEHDGWSCMIPIDIDRLCYEVKQQTGFVIKLDKAVYEYTESY